MQNEKNSSYKAVVFFVSMFLLASVLTVSGNSWNISINGKSMPTNKQMFLYGGDSFDMDYTYYFYEPDITEVVKNSVVYHRVTMENCLTDGDVDTPLLPFKTVSILLPQGYGVMSLKANSQDMVSIGDGYNVELGQMPETLGINLGQGRQSSSNYDPSKPYPVKDCERILTSDLRGYKIFTFLVYPIHYIGDTGELYYYEQIDITIKVAETGGVSPLFRDLAKDELILEEYVEDYSMSYTYGNSGRGNNPSRMINPLEQYDYVIITNEYLKNAPGPNNFQALRDYKNLIGTPTKIVTVEEIYDNYNGVDNPEKIRNFIKDVYFWWGVDYVLLGGDNSIIPARYFFIKIEQDEVPSDLYYSALNGNFNADGDQYWGEAGEDLCDLFADVYIGRACVETYDELSNFNKKTLDYTNTKDEYLKKVLMAGEQLDSQTWGGDNLDELIDESFAGGFYTKGIPSDVYDIEKLYDRDYPGHDWPKSEIITRINGGQHIINHNGHSNYGYNLRMNLTNIEDLTNDKYCFIYSNGCMAGGFDDPKGYDCAAEYFTVKTDHGAFAGIWNTRYGWYWKGMNWGLSQNFHREFWNVIFGKGESFALFKQLGPANERSKTRFVDRLFIPYVGDINRYCYYEITLFGDPQVDIKKPMTNDPKWISPDGYNDPGSAWDNENYAIDGYTQSKAGCTISQYGWVWTPYIELKMNNPINCDKIRFYAWFDDYHCDEADVDVYYNNGWHDVFEGEFNGYSFETKEFNEQSLSKARIRFHVQRWILWKVTADLHEFQFYRVV